MAFRAAIIYRRVPECVIAFGIFGTRIKHFAITRFALEDTAFFALGAFDTRILRFFQWFNVFALRISAASDKFAILTDFKYQR